LLKVLLGGLNLAPTLQFWLFDKITWNQRILVSLGNIFGYTFSNERVSRTIWVCSNLGCSHALKVVVYSILNVLIVCVCAVELWVYDSWENLSIESNWFLSEYLWISNVAFSKLSERVVMWALFDLFLYLSSSGWYGSSDCILSIDHLIADVRFIYEVRWLGLSGCTCWNWLGSRRRKILASSREDPAGFSSEMRLKHW